MKKILLIMAFSFVSLFAIENLTTQNLEKKIKNKNIIIDFYATWCPPCKILSKNLEDFSKVKPKNVKIYKVDIDKQMDLAIKYNIRVLPTVVFIKNSKVIETKTGILSIEEFKNKTKKYFN